MWDTRHSFRVLGGSILLHNGPTVWTSTNVQCKISIWSMDGPSG